MIEFFFEVLLCLGALETKTQGPSVLEQCVRPIVWFGVSYLFSLISFQ